MKISVRWVNEYLEPGDISAEEAERALTFAGFPIESAERLASGDTQLDVEVTSNRGDVLSHVGVAREIAAATGRKFRPPAPDRVFSWHSSGRGAGAPTSGRRVDAAASTAVSIDNRVPAGCPMFTARVLRGVKALASPAWMVEALAAVGQRSINAVVDVTNFVAFEYGQPTHVFDLRTIHSTGGRAGVVVREARAGEKLKLLDGRTVTLAAGELIVADERDGGRPISLAGVMGGFDTQVTSATTDVLLEAATWDPVKVRQAARRLGIRTDASYRFERIVDARTIDAAADRAAALIAQIAGGEILAGVVRAGPDPKPFATVTLRPARCRAMLGMEIPTATMRRILESHEIKVSEGKPSTGEAPLACTIPAHRPDLEREIDLIEEVARTNGLDALPVHEKIAVGVAPPQPSEQAVREIGRVLGGLGFFEAITFTFVAPELSAPFLPRGLESMSVSDERRAADPVLRPSALPSLLACRRKNQDAGAAREDAGSEQGVRLYEISSAFAQTPAPAGSRRGESVERVNLAIIADACFPAGAKSAEQRQHAVRMLRGAIESMVGALGGAAGRVEIVPADQPPASAFDGAAFAEVRINGERAGCFGLITAKVQSAFGLERPVVAAELSLESLVRLYPPKSMAHALPQFPSIERDLSLIVDEGVAWGAIDRLVAGLGVPLLEAWSFVGAYRGQQTGAGKKSVTFRMRFRDPARTLKHDEVTPQVESIVGAARRDLGADIRTV